MLDTIKHELEELEIKYSIKVLYACESGSRAWGFKSPDSDFDVRFIYARNTNDYLSITELKDVIDLPINDLLDIGGWDVKKSLKLFLKSNSPLYEWLQSPIIYKDDSGFATEVRFLMHNYYSLRSGGNHYLSMAINTVNNDLQGGEVKIKRYFYALRSTLACKWIIEKQEVPPMEFEKLRILVDDEIFQASIDDLLKLKAVSDEKTLIKQVPVVNKWLNDTLEFCKEEVSKLPANHKTTEKLDLIFRKYISK
ncbi:MULTISPECIES: nucleotidyltransferase domain-containing protein [unclassified Mucilaginibacter]|uniref:nucleotidyltransferase domain-containing protein n=1 Tax=unclassified Mucilaginibacter TaxID=2617802 RepID=UPI002AC915F1|nr:MULTISPECIES: nucleotidyltransferase domain-containing protein [unclassified Mucilaginibacter]MEB0263599.1 nucleotidyltransferase domain-containing protein [Mucilaginibacter sp. 10I4]MEB0278023.1 nucleotidyltransferase domain-containing protein [Mucilaginibacter sp. 10B2]MEB0299624.1 nucleotidyltransferase domain-containing protein [Mucilaginibacter sp. 5C4]WPX22912.1 nucleotidyltransferase domain-containing protein [Mucilaginibacter sp. 5C4]